MTDESMDVDAVLEKQNRALSLQYRSVIQQTLTSGSLFGFEFQPLGEHVIMRKQNQIDFLLRARRSS